MLEGIMGVDIVILAATACLYFTTFYLVKKVKYNVPILLVLLLILLSAFLGYEIRDNGVIPVISNISSTK
jgi:hypothetical protein